MTGITTILFDLDGTLLPMNTDRFVKGYFKHLVPHMAGKLAPDVFVQRVWAATNEMSKDNHPDHSNEKVFRKAFFQFNDIDEEATWSSMHAFYEGPFGELHDLAGYTPTAREVCETALDKGYKIVLATNPVFPRAATLHRMRWAKIDDLPWTLVTTFEDMHFTKTSVNYFREILDRIGETPDRCMMVGNDPEEDGAAVSVGIRTFLVTADEELPSDFHQNHFAGVGSLEDFLQLLQKGLS